MLKLKNKIEIEDGQIWLAEVNSSDFNKSRERRIHAVTDIASVTKGRLGFQENLEDFLDLDNNEPRVSSRCN